MKTDTATMDNVTVTDHSRTQPKPVEQEKPKEKSPEQKEWDQKGRNKAFSRMFPNAKEEGDDKKGDKTSDKKSGKDAETKKDGKVVTADKAEQKPETKSEKTDDKKSGKESPDGGDGKQGKKEEPESPETTEKPKLKPTAKKEATQPPVDYNKLAETVATATAKAIKADKATEKKDDDVPEARRRDLTAVEYLERENPRYKGKVADFKKFAKAEADYAAQWLKDNPGRKFDPEDDDHTDWYEKHEPDIDPTDIEDARIEMAAERRAKALVEKETGATKQELEQIKLERDIERADRVVPPLLARNAALLGSAMGEEVAKAMAALKEGESLETTDPAAHATLMQMLPELKEKTIEANRIFSTEGRAYDAKNPVHRAVFEETLELEALFLEQGDEKLKQPDGRTYAKLSEWAEMTPEQRAKHWTINADLITAHLANKAAEKAGPQYKSERERVETLAKAYGYTKNGASETAHTQKVEEREETEQDNTKVRSPSTSTRTVIQPGTSASPKTAQSGADLMLNKMFRR